MFAILLLGNISKVGIVLGCVVVGFCLLVLFGLSIIWIGVRADLNKEKQHMFICEKHGTFPESALLHYEFEDEGHKKVKVPRCPVCMRNDYAQMQHEIKLKNVLPWKGKSA